MNRLHRLSDAALLDRTARDSQAFTTFYRRHERLILRYLLGRGCDSELAADLMAETFAHALEAADRFDPDLAGGEEAVAWLLAIARNALRTSVRDGAVAEAARRLLELEPVALDDADIERIASLGAGDSALERLVSELPPDQRQAVIARILDERDYGDIAAQLGCSQLVVRKRVSRGLSRLRTALNPLNS